MPGADREDGAAEGGGNGGRDGEDEVDQRQDADGFAADEKVAHHGAGEGNACRNTKALEDATDEQHFEVLRRSADESPEHIDGKENDADDTAAETVRERTANQLRQGEGGEIDRKRELAAGIRRAEVDHHGGKGRSIKGEAEWTGRDHEAADDGGAAAGHGAGSGGRHV